MMVGVSSRTRSKKVPLFSGFSLDCSSSKRKKSDEDGISLESVSGSKRRRVKNETFVFPKNHQVIFIDDDDYDEDGSEQFDVDLKKEVKSDESGGSCEIGDNKEGKFDDEKCGWEKENPITIDLDDEDFVDSEAADEAYDVRKEVKVDRSAEFVDKDEVFLDLDDSVESDEDDDSDEDETSDEDFRGEEVNEIIDNDDDSSSESSFADDDDDDDDDDEDEEEEEEEEEEEKEKKKKGWRKYFNVVEELAREVNDEKSGEEEEKKIKGSRKSFNVVEELTREVNDEKSGEKEKKKKKVIEIFDSCYGSSNDVEVDDDDDDDEEVEEEEEEVGEVEKNGLRKPNNVVEVEEEVKEMEVDDGISNEVIVDDEEGEVKEEEEEENGSKKLNNVVVEDEEEMMKKLWQEYDNCLMEEEPLRGVKDKTSGISKRNNEKKKIKINPFVYHNEVEHSDYGSATASTTFNPMKGCSSKPKEASEKHKAKNVEIKVENVCHDDDNVNVAKSKAKYSAKPTENVKVGSDEGKEQHVKRLLVVGISSVQTKQEKVKVGDSVEGKEQHVKGFGVGGVSSVQIKQETVEDLDKQEMMEDKPREDYKGGINIQNGVKKESTDNNGLNRRVRSTPSMPNKLPLAQYLAELYRSNKEGAMKNESIVLEMNDDSANQKDTPQPPVCAETPSLIWSLKRVVPKTKEEEELDKELEKNKPLWDEMERAIRESEAESEIGNLGTNRSPSPHCEHITILDEQLGVYCKLCGDVITEIKYITQLVEDRYPNEGSRRRASIGGDDVSLFDRSHLNVSDGDSKANVSHAEVTVWDKIPDVKQTLYPHQQEGFEFIWKNLAGSFKLQKLKNADPRSEGGCIISHAPGTGKTRLTIVFLKAYLKLFPKCLPIVVAPAGILQNWEEEFKKWDIGVPFHNLSNVELSGKEHADVFNRFDRFSTRHRTDETRMAKLISWFKETSILGISYNLYGTICHNMEKQKDKSVKERKGNFDLRKVLLKAPGLLVLDEGHTPRNQRSQIWKVLSKSQTQKRIILSGTPFQNNFWELYSTLRLVKPSFLNTIPPELKKFCQKQRQRSSNKWSWEPVSGNTARDPSDDDKIEKLKLLMDPFVHVHKGSILEDKLPGLKECLVTLKADSLQNEILKRIKRSKNSVFNFERKIALTSVHPSLFLECALSKEEESEVDKDQLEKLRLNPHEGVKTKFVYEFVRLCDAFKEKVLVFSQFLAPLRLIEAQLNSAFKWSEGKEVMFISGDDPPRVKQSIIHSFNDENCQAKVLLATTKACSEGISLVGASRVVLLDVVWNPSVERQAISRAYRIGQKKVVYTYHLLAEGSTEEEKYGKQAEKDRLSELLFSAKSADVSKRCAVNFEDEVLDKMTRHEKLLDMFVKCVVLRKKRDLV